MSRLCTLGVGCESAGVCYASAMGEPNRCDARPDQPAGEDNVWYRGWEVGWDGSAAIHTSAAWFGYKGGCDLDAPQVSGESFEQVLDEIDAEMDQ